MINEIKKYLINIALSDLTIEYNDLMKVNGDTEDDLNAMLDKIDNIRDCVRDLEVTITEALEDE